jgi:hypothetical protein
VLTDPAGTATPLKVVAKAHSVAKRDAVVVHRSVVRPLGREVADPQRRIGE